MSLFSWFSSSKKNEYQKELEVQSIKEVEKVNENTMWPTAKVRRNIIVKQQEFTNSIHEKNDIVKSKALDQKEAT